MSEPRPTESAPNPAALSPGVLARVFFRSLFFQAAWNPQGMQNLGMAYALYPALERLYPEPPRLKEAVRRHLEFFNTHPYVAAGIVGGVLFHEQKVARGEEPADRVMAYKTALMGPMAALGDGFFWLSLEPAVGALCAALAPWLLAWAAVLFVVLYNAVHLTLRARFFRMGFRLGDGLVGAVGKAKLPVRGTKLRGLAAASAGAAAGWMAVAFGLRAGGAFGVALAVACLGAGVAGYALTGGRVSRYAVLYGVAILAGLVAVFS